MESFLMEEEEIIMEILMRLNKILLPTPYIKNSGLIALSKENE